MSKYYRNIKCMTCVNIDVMYIWNNSSNYFIYTSHHFTPHGRYELNKLSSLPICGFIAQLVEQRTGNAEVTGSNPIEALIFFRLLLSNCLNWKIYCDDHSSLSCVNIFVLFLIRTCEKHTEHMDQLDSEMEQHMQRMETRIRQEVCFTAHLDLPVHCMHKYVSSSTMLDNSVA